MSTQIDVSAKPIFKGSISPLIYGEFVEFLNDMIPGMWADRIQDRSFEGLSQPGAFYRKEKDFPKPVWRGFRALTRPYGQRANADVAFELDPHKPFVGTQSARIRVGGWPGFLAGIIQDNVGVRKGEKLHVQLFLRGERLGGKVRVLIGRDYGACFTRYDEVAFAGVSGTWRKFKGTLTAPVTDASASFAIVLDAPGTLWIDKVSLMPAQTVGGWRPDIVEAVAAVKPGIIRFGGSSLIYYDWRKGLGPREHRAPFLNRPWNNTEENDVGLDEFLQFCEAVRAEPLLCVNSNANTPEDIAAQVQYVNGSAKTEQGRLRIRNGHAAPYRVKYWQIGNEQSGIEYEKGLPRFARAMKAADPTIHLMASYPSPNIINNLSADIEYVCPHFYTPDAAVWSKRTDDLRASIAASPMNPRLKLGVTEWNHTGGDWGEQRVWLQTLYNGLSVARMLNYFHRNGDLIRVANRSNLVNSCWSGSIQTSPLDLYCTPAHYVQGLYSNLSGEIALSAGAGDAALDISATMTRKGGRVILWVVNPTEGDKESAVVFKGLPAARSVKAHVMSGKDPSLVNSFQQKDAVAFVEERLRPSARMRARFPAYSVTALAFETK